RIAQCGDRGLAFLGRQRPHRHAVQVGWKLRFRALSLRFLDVSDSIPHPDRSDGFLAIYRLDQRISSEAILDNALARSAHASTGSPATYESGSSGRNHLGHDRTELLGCRVAVVAGSGRPAEAHIHGKVDDTCSRLLNDEMDRSRRPRDREERIVPNIV